MRPRSSLYLSQCGGCQSFGTPSRLRMGPCCLRSASTIFWRMARSAISRSDMSHQTQPNQWHIRIEMRISLKTRSNPGLNLMTTCHSEP